LDHAAQIFGPLKANQLESPSIRSPTRSPYLRLPPAAPPTAAAAPRPAALLSPLHSLPSAAAASDQVDEFDVPQPRWRRLRPPRRCCGASGAPALAPPPPRFSLAGSLPLIPRPLHPRRVRRPGRATSRATVEETSAAAPLGPPPTLAPGSLRGSMRPLWLPGRRTKLLPGRDARATCSSLASSILPKCWLCWRLFNEAAILSCSPESPVTAASGDASTSTATAASRSEIVDFIKSAFGELEGNYTTAFVLCAHS